MPPESPPEQYQSLTAAEVQRFFDARNTAGPCPCCGTFDWTLAGHPPGSIWAATSLTPGGGARYPTPHIPLLILLCDNCFYIRTHAAAAINQWLKNNPKPENGK